ncbi:uncharacterized protein LOC144146621 [Haemaphysalis longicornis]
MAVFVLASGFTGHMKASLTMKEEGSRIDSLADIIARPEVVPVIIKGTTYEELFRSSPDRMQRLTWERANRLGSIIPPKQVFTREVYEDVLHSKKVFEFTCAI